MLKSSCIKRKKSPNGPYILIFTINVFYSENNSTKNGVYKTINIW